MGQYFQSKGEAEDAIREWGNDVQMFVHIRDGSTERWMVDFKRRPIPDSIALLEDLTDEIPSIIAGK